MKQTAIMTRFFTAIIMGDLKTVKEIMPDNPAWPCWLSPADYPPLHMAILNNREDVAAYFAEHGADLNQQAEGATAASLAERKNMLEKLQEAAGRKDRIRAEAIEACGEQMRTGLEGAVKVVPRITLVRRNNSPKI